MNSISNYPAISSANNYPSYPSINSNYPSDFSANLSPNFPQNIPSDFPPNFPQNIPSEFPPNYPQNLAPNLPQNFPSNLPQHFPQHFPSDISPNFSPNLPPGYPHIPYAPIGFPLHAHSTPVTNHQQNGDTKTTYWRPFKALKEKFKNWFSGNTGLKNSTANQHHFPGIHIFQHELPNMSREWKGLVQQHNQ